MGSKFLWNQLIICINRQHFGLDRNKIGKLFVSAVKVEVWVKVMGEWGRGMHVDSPEACHLWHLNTPRWLQVHNSLIELWTRIGTIRVRDTFMYEPFTGCIWSCWKWLRYSKVVYYSMKLFNNDNPALWDYWSRFKIN